MTESVAAARALLLEFGAFGPTAPHDFGHPTGRGMRCLCDVRKGEPLLEVPLDKAITAEFAKRVIVQSLASASSPDTVVPEPLTSQDLLCIWLLFERSQGMESAYATYVASLPVDVDEMCASYWPSTVLQELHGSDAMVRLETLKDAIAAAHARVVNAAKDCAAMAQLLQRVDFTEERYAWARCVLNSRQFGGSWADTSELGVLAPACEFFNHCCYLPQGQYLRRDEGRGMLQVLAGRDFAEGSEAMISYGRLSCAQMLERGFAIEANPEDAVELIMSVKCNDLRCPLLLEAGRTEIGREEDFEWRVLPVCGVSEAEARIVLRKNHPLPAALLSLSRIDSLQDAQLSAGPQPGSCARAPFGLLAETTVLSKLLRIAGAMQGRYGTSNIEDDEPLQQLCNQEEMTVSEARRAMAVQTCRGEKAVFAALADEAVLQIMACLEALEGRTSESTAGTVWWQYLQSKSDSLHSMHSQVITLFQCLNALPLGTAAHTQARHAQNCSLAFLWLHNLLGHPLRYKVCVGTREGCHGAKRHDDLASWADEAASGDPGVPLANFLAKMEMWGRYLLAQFAVTNAFALKDMNAMQMETISIRNSSSWSIPTNIALSMLAGHMPLLEIGGGNGTWAQLLKDKGVDIVCFDTSSGDTTYGPQVEAGTALMGSRCPVVQSGGPEQVAMHPERTLVLMWPDYHGEGSFGIECFRAYKGNHLVLVGEWTGRTFGLVHPWGQSFSQEFQQCVEADFEEVQHCALPQWPLFCDHLSVWKRRSPL